MSAQQVGSHGPGREVEDQIWQVSFLECVLKEFRYRDPDCRIPEPWRAAAHPLRSLRVASADVVGLGSNYGVLTKLTDSQNAKRAPLARGALFPFGAPGEIDSLPTAVRPSGSAASLRGLSARLARLGSNSRPPGS